MRIINRYKILTIILSVIVFSQYSYYTKQVEEIQEEADTTKEDLSNKLAQQIKDNQATKEELKNKIAKKDRAIKEIEQHKQEKEKQIEELEKELRAKPKVVKRTETKVRDKQSTTGKELIGTFEATAYDDSPASQGQWVGQTATGMKPRVGVIAVDPSVIPLGTKLYVEGYGNCIAGDTGGAIKGNKVDLFMNTREECYNWGRKNVKVYKRN